MCIVVEFARLLFQPLLLFCVQEQADAEEPKDAVLASLKSVDHRPEAQDFTLQYVGVSFHAPLDPFSMTALGLVVSQILSLVYILQALASRFELDREAMTKASLFGHYRRKLHLKMS